MYIYIHILFLIYGGFHKWGTPIAGLFIIENPIKTIWGYPYLRKPPYGDIATSSCSMRVGR